LNLTEQDENLNFTVLLGYSNIRTDTLDFYLYSNSYIMDPM